MRERAFQANVHGVRGHVDSADESGSEVNGDVNARYGSPLMALPLVRPNCNVHDRIREFDCRDIW